MNAFTFVLAAIFLLVVVPLWILFNFLGKIRASKMLTNEDEKMLSELWQTAGKMEKRIEVLETIIGEPSEERSGS